MFSTMQDSAQRVLVFMSCSGYAFTAKGDCKATNYLFVGMNVVAVDDEEGESKALINNTAVLFAVSDGQLT